jgi:2,4-dienoyl-CoA reductase-like NADH-dependent reductase (Old Yellow Enzyme family)
MIVLSPVTVGPVRLRNRVAVTSHQTGLVHDHLPTDDLVAYHRARAEGGAGALFIEATAVHETGLLTAHTLGGYLPAIVAGYQRLAGPVHDAGGRMFVQLFHGGREQISSAPRPPAVAPSAVPTQRFHVEPRALTMREIRELLAGYTRSARNARDGGLDGVELSASHGYLPAQFFSTRVNRRDDEYGARLRFVREALAAVREGAGDGLAVTIRLSADEISADGLHAAECSAIAAELASDGLVDLVSVVLGDSATTMGASYIVPPPGSIPIEPAASVMRHALPDHVPLLVTSAIFDLRAADDLIARGVCDLAGMTRAHIADPALVSKAATGEPAIPCIGCNQGCIGHYHAGTPIACVVNVRTGRERIFLARAGKGRRVLVVGAGPAGLAAALEAARGGDDVRLLESAVEIGGQFRVAGLAPAHAQAWSRYHAWASAEVRRLGIDLRLGTTATAADADGYDLVVLATGAVPYRLPASTCCPLVDAWTALADPAAVTGPVLVADWGGGHEGLDVAEALATAGHRVTLAVAAFGPGETVHQYQRSRYLARLDELGVTLRPHSELVVCPDNQPLLLRNIHSGREEEVTGYRTVVAAAGRVPHDPLWAALEGTLGVVRAGDVLSPRGLEEAVLDGALAVRDGRVSLPSTGFPARARPASAPMPRPALTGRARSGWPRRPPRRPAAPR